MPPARRRSSTSIRRPGGRARPTRSGRAAPTASMPRATSISLLQPSSGDVYAQLAATRGQAHVAIADSVVAGVAVAGSASLVNSDGAAKPTLDLVAGGNSVHAQGRLAASGGRDEWQFADRCAAARAAVVVARRSGHAQGPGRARARSRARSRRAARVDGRWPDVRSEGELHGTDLRYDTIAVRRAEGRWSVGSTADAALDATLDDRWLAVAGRVVDSARARLSGTARAHGIDLRVESQALPPEWIDALSARGGPSASRGGVWPLRPLRPHRLRRRSLRRARRPAAASSCCVPKAASSTSAASDRRDGKARSASSSRAASPPPSRTWAQREGRPRQRRLGAAGRCTPSSSRAAPTRSARRCAGAASPGAPASAARRPRSTRMPSSTRSRSRPCCARCSPTSAGAATSPSARTSTSAARRRCTVDVVVERARGDLTVTDEYGTQGLGLTDLRFGIAANDGAVELHDGARRQHARRRLGRGDGAHRSARRPGPTPRRRCRASSSCASPISAPGARWVPAGWRLAGALHASASIGGRFDAPRYTGHVEGSQLGVRNFLQGVNVTDGDLAIALEGNTARIEHFTAKGGSGTLSLQGDASFDDAPVAQLKLAARQFELLGRVDRRIVASGDASMRLDAKDARARRRVHDRRRLDRLLALRRAVARRRRRGRSAVLRRAPISPAAAASAAAAPAVALGGRRAGRAPGRARPARRHGREAAHQGPRPRLRAARRAAPDVAGRPAHCRRHAAHRRRHLPGLRAEADHRPRRAHLRRPDREPAPRHRGDAAEPRRARRRRRRRHRAQPAHSPLLASPT